MNKLLATLLILCSGPVWAEWILIGTRGEPGTLEYGEIFYDPSTIRGREIKKFWTKTAYLYATLKTLHETDCREQKIRSLQTSSYMNDSSGKLINQTPVPSPWVYIAPDNGYAELIKLVCGKK